MSLKREMTLHEARIIAVRLVKLFQPACEWIEIGGSLRRQNPIIKDIELVIIPKVQEKNFKHKKGQKDISSFIHIIEETTIQSILDGLSSKQITILKNGPKYKQIYFHEDKVQLDLFIASKLNLGLILMIRTGSADYAKNFMIELKKQGQYESKDGYLLEKESQRRIPVPTERELYRIVGFPYCEPKDRFDRIYPTQEVEQNTYTCVECGEEFITKFILNPEKARCYICYKANPNYYTMEA